MQDQDNYNQYKRSYSLKTHMEMIKNLIYDYDMDIEIENKNTQTYIKNYN
jgi:hypothetical protein